jgi:phosphopantetheinyl transferase
MQAIESETLILYHTDLRGQWPESAARALGARLRYAKRLATSSDGPAARATLAGIALALRALARLSGRTVGAGEIVFARGAKPRLAGAAPAAEPAPAACDFSISHSGPWVGCAAVSRGRVGFDVELGSGARIESWVAREAALKASGAGLAALDEVQLGAGQAHCRGERWYAHAPQLFPGAAACVMTDRAGQQLQARAVALAELFAP